MHGDLCIHFVNGPIGIYFSDLAHRSKVFDDGARALLVGDEALLDRHLKVTPILG